MMKGYVGSIINDDDDDDLALNDEPLQLQQQPKPYPVKRPFTGGKAPLKHHAVSKKKVKRPRETADVALEQVQKKKDELAKAEKRAGNAVSKDFNVKKWKTETWNKQFKEMIDRMIRTHRDRISPTTRVMTKHRLNLVRYNMIHPGEDRSLFRYDLQRGQRNKTMNTLETISIIGSLEYNAPIADQLAEPVSLDAMHVKILLCTGENNAERFPYASDDAFRRLIQFVRACTSKRLKDKGRGDEEEDDDQQQPHDDDDDSAENTIATFTPEQRKLFMSTFLSFAIEYVCELGPYMDETMIPPNQYVDATLVYQYTTLASHK